MQWVEAQYHKTVASAFFFGIIGGTIMILQHLRRKYSFVFETNLKGRIKSHTSGYRNKKSRTRPNFEGFTRRISCWKRGMCRLGFSLLNAHAYFICYKDSGFKRESNTFTTSRAWATDRVEVFEVWKNFWNWKKWFKNWSLFPKSNFFITFKIGPISSLFLK